MHISHVKCAGLVAIATAAVFSSTLTAVSQERCAPREAWLTTLAGPEWNEQVGGLGVVRNAEGEGVSIIELFLAADGKTFSVLATEPRPGGMWSCLIASGYDWNSYEAHMGEAS